MLKIILLSILLTCVNCGFMDLFSSNKEQESSGKPRVVDGEAPEERISYQISLQMQNKEGSSGGGILGEIFQWIGGNSGNKNFSHFCGGSVLDEKHIVTAGHCIKGFNISRMSVFAGTNDLRNENEGQRKMVDNCIIHPDYVELNTSDIAVCRLKESFMLGDTIQPIELGTENVGGDVECLLTGWGYRFRVLKGMPPSALQQAKFHTITNDECSKSYNVNPTELCTKSSRMEGACNGDSGGPLVADNKLIGVVSYGLIVCGTNQPDVYTRVSEFTEWINEVRSSDNLG